ncbi:MAG: hypothetical protein IIB28_07485, partial [Chloroflexi bacterium]|nr:hypothetical protein [Chloroflexota bacterium]
CNNRVQVFSPEGRFLMKWGSAGSGDGQFRTPFSIAVDASGNVYVAEPFNHRVQVFSPEGRFLMKWGSEGSGDGQFLVPALIALDGSGNVFVADLDNHRVQVFSLDLTELPTPTSSPTPAPVPNGTSVEPFDGVDMRALLSDEEVEAAIPLVIAEMRFPPTDLRGLAGDEGMVGIDSLWGHLFMSAGGAGQLMVIVTDFESLEPLQQQIAVWTASVFQNRAGDTGDYLERTKPTIGDGSLQGREGGTVSVRFWKGDKTVMLNANGLPATQEVLAGLVALAELAESRLDGRRGR